jgi:hypothetical protein
VPGAFCEALVRIERTWARVKGKVIRSLSTLTVSYSPAGSRRRFFFMSLLIFGAQAYGKHHLRSGISFGLQSGMGFALGVRDYWPLS